jgi:hypothetical protein
MSLADQVKEAYKAGLESAINCARSRARHYMTSVSQYDQEAKTKATDRAAVLDLFADDLEIVKNKS